MPVAPTSTRNGHNDMKHARHFTSTPRSCPLSRPFPHCCSVPPAASQLCDRQVLQRLLRAPGSQFPAVAVGGGGRGWRRRRDLVRVPHQRKDATPSSPLHRPFTITSVLTHPATLTNASPIIPSSSLISYLQRVLCCTVAAWAEGPGGITPPALLRALQHYALGFTGELKGAVFCSHYTKCHRQ